MKEMSIHSTVESLPFLFTIVDRRKSVLVEGAERTGLVISRVSRLDR
jgi:hypothetical protein